MLLELRLEVAAAVQGSFRPSGLRGQLASGTAVREVRDVPREDVASAARDGSSLMSEAWLIAEAGEVRLGDPGELRVPLVLWWVARTVKMSFLGEL